MASVARPSFSSSSSLCRCLERLASTQTCLRHGCSTPVPRTIQYGDCSCWKSGCGEFDVFEVLNSGNTKAISAWHGLNSKGDSSWFQRPTAKTMKAAVVLDGSSGTIHVVALPDSTTFDTSLTDSAVSSFINSVTDSKLNVKVTLP